MLAILLGLMSGSPVPVSDAPPVMLSLSAPPAKPYGSARPPSEDGYRCQREAGDCFRIVPNGADGFALQVFDMDGAARNEQAPLALPLSPEAAKRGNARVFLWDRAVQLRRAAGEPADTRAYLVGVIESQFNEYGGHSLGTGEWLRLFRVAIIKDSYTLGKDVLSLPWRRESDIRRCFDDTDARSRRGACRDQVRFTASLTLDSRVQSGAWPMFRYVTQASAEPRTASPRLDAGQVLPRRADLVAWRDPLCSFTRTYRYDDRRGRYVTRPTAPPACDGYARLP